MLDWLSQRDPERHVRMTVTNAATGTNICEIAEGIYRINTPVAMAGDQQFSFNQYLIVAEKPSAKESPTRVSRRRDWLVASGHFSPSLRASPSNPDGRVWAEANCPFLPRTLRSCRAWQGRGSSMALDSPAGAIHSFNDMIGLAHHSA